jgi:hypothetical protein
MNIKLIQGEFTPEEATELFAQLTQVKIRHHESLITKDASEEDIKYRETRIKQLQNDLVYFRDYVNNKKSKIRLDANLLVEVL